MANTDDDDWDHFKQVFDPFLNGSYETIKYYLDENFGMDRQSGKDEYLEIWTSLQNIFRRLFQTVKEQVFCASSWKKELEFCENKFRESYENIKEGLMDSAYANLSRIERRITGFLSSLNAPSLPLNGGI